MLNHSNWNWVEKLSNRLHLPYLIVSILFGIVVYLILYLFYLKLLNGEISNERYLIMAMAAAAITYQLCGNQFLLIKMKSIFSNLNYLSNEDGNKTLSRLNIKFESSHWYYLIMILIIVPFYLINWVNPLILFNTSMLVGFFNIYLEFFLGFSMLFLLGNILWIIINIAWGLNDTANNSAGFNTSVSIFAFVTKIKSIRSSITRVLVYYFIDIALLIWSYLNPSYIGKYEIIALVVLLLIGVVLFFIGLNAIQNVLKARLEFEYDLINRKIQEQNQKLILIISEGDFAKIDQINFVSSALDGLRKQKEDLVNIDTRIYDLSTLSAFVTSFLIPALSVYINNKNKILISQNVLNNIYTNITTYIEGSRLLLDTIRVIK
jgi:hypothetical protein